MKSFLLAAMALIAFSVDAQEWPSKPVRIVVPFPPGGATGAIAGELLARAEPDGHTLMSTPPAPLVINPSLFAKLPYDPTSQGTTSVSFLTTEMFLAAAGGLKIQQVPYKGTGPALTAVLAGETELFFDNLGTSLQHVRSGRLEALAVCGERRHPSLPDVPAMNEIYPGFVSVAWFGIVAPPKTPAAIAEKLSASVNEILKMLDVLKRLADLSAEPIGMGPAQMARFMKDDAERWREAIRAAGLKPGAL